MRDLLPRLGYITRTGLADCTAAPASPSGNVKVVSYNVLSDSLGRPSHYIHSAKEDCNAKIRLGRVKQQLEVQMQKGAIICLQDVSRKWGAQLVPFFTEHGYTYAAALTGSKFGGYMGQCVEWPTGVYSVQDVDAYEKHPKHSMPVVMMLQSLIINGVRGPPHHHTISLTNHCTEALSRASLQLVIEDFSYGFG